MSLQLTWKIFLKSVTESNFRKYLGLYVNSSGVTGSKVRQMRFQGFWEHFHYMKYVVLKNLKS